MVAFILRDNACPNNFDVNFTALKKNKIIEFIIAHTWCRIKYLAICLK